jgi:prolycopene isomerase
MWLAAAAAGSLALEWTAPGTLAAKANKDRPVVVIGGGLAGLCAAAHLARSGFPVTLVEQHDKPGGYATTFDRAGGKYVFDVSLHSTAGVRGGLRPSLEGAGVLDKIESVELPEVARIITPDYDMTWPQRDPESIVEMLTKTIPKEAQAFRGFFGEMMGILDEAMEPFDPDVWWHKMIFPFTHGKMWNIRKLTLADMLDKYTRDVKARALLSTFWGYYGLPPSKLSAFYYCIATAALLRFGSHIIKNRSQDLSDALARAIEEAGGRIMFQKEAVGISMDRDSITEVRLADGLTLKAAAVISNASAPATMDMLPKGAAPEEYLRQLASYRPSISSFNVWLGLNRNIRGDVKGYEIFVSRDYDPEKIYQAALACNPYVSRMAVTICDNSFDGYSKPGTSTVTITMLSGYEPWRRFESDYFGGRKEEYRKEKERIANCLIDETERLVIPNLRSMIEVTEASTPLTNIRYTKNPEGAIYGYEQSLANSYMNRLPVRTPIKGLYFASAWSDPGGGYQPCLMSGVKAFREVVKDTPA